MCICRSASLSIDQFISLSVYAIDCAIIGPHLDPHFTQKLLEGNISDAEDALPQFIFIFVDAWVFQVEKQALA